MRAERAEAGMAKRKQDGCNARRKLAIDAVRGQCGNGFGRGGLQFEPLLRRFKCFFRRFGNEQLRLGSPGGYL
ncbi:hypothetical protein GCM10027594_22820 [Hymenobacter agri]